MNVIALGMAGPTIMAHGTEEQKRRYLPTDALRRRDLVPGLLRARRRLRPLGGADAHRAARRPLPRQRPEGLVVARAPGRLLHPRRPQRPGLRAPRGPHVPDRRHARAGRRGAAAAPDHRRGGVQRDLLHRRPRPAREPARRDRRRLAGRDDDAAARARHARLRAHRRPRRPAAAPDRAREGARGRRPDHPRPGRAGVDRAPGAQADELPLADDADADGHSGAGGLGRRSCTGPSRTSV